MIEYFGGPFDGIVLGDLCQQPVGQVRAACPVPCSGGRVDYVAAMLAPITHYYHKYIRRDIKGRARLEYAGVFERGSDEPVKACEGAAT